MKKLHKIFIKLIQSALIGVCGISLANAANHPLHSSLNTNTVKAFLSHNDVVDKQQFLSTPYIVSFEGEHISGAPDQEIYVRSILDAHARDYAIYRLGQPYIDPQTHQFLGYESIYIGKARLTTPGDPAILTVTEARNALMQGDRLLPYENDIMKNIPLHNPILPVHGQIISVLGEGTTQLGQNVSVAINRGGAEGVRSGDVLDVHALPSTINDPIAKSRVTLPGEKEGKLIVYKVFDHLSYALVSDSTKVIHLYDVVNNPSS